MVPDLLFFTPLLPFTTGTGSAMRAAAAVELLAERYRVWVIHAELWGWRKDVFSESWIRQTAAGYFTLPAQPDAAALDDLIRNRLGGISFDAAYVYRLVTAPLALRVLGSRGGQRPRAILDLDDDECARAERFIPLAESSGRPDLAAAQRTELATLGNYQKMLLSRFEASLLASPLDCELLAQRFPHQRFVHLPNVVRAAPDITASEREANSLLFLGTLDYLPNEDGIAYFCESILLLLRARGVAPKVRVVGTSPSPRVAALVRFPEVELVGAVSDVAVEYARNQIMIVPLRAGGGTRIKILEAFSFLLPVVSTSIGAEGLNIVDGEQLLIADSPEEFADACAGLLKDAQLRDRLSANAAAWVAQHHSMDRARTILQAVLG